MDYVEMFQRWIAHITTNTERENREEEEIERERDDNV